MTNSARMFLRPHQRSKDGKDHTYWSLVETVRTANGPRQRTLCYLGELNGSAQARWLKSVEVFNEQGEAQQLKLFPSHVEVPDDDPPVARTTGPGGDGIVELTDPQQFAAHVSRLGGPGGEAERNHQRPDAGPEESDDSEYQKEEREAEHDLDQT